ncbi:ABC transporter substrate-binding protein [Spirillospora sp. NPDC047279]|uniref:ABC transporter substrate-binding protein n=1 Tax=Spirillospora sp. NPDC047279 TaxID=3155478 RepID=UPI0033FEECDD
MQVLPLRPGDPDRLSGYRLSGLLGEGGQGSVFLGEDDDGVRVAVKLLHARFSGHPKARQRFAAELEVARRVAVFCTARILDADVEGDRPYIVSEFIDGPPLADVLTSDGPRTGADLDRIAIGTITALAAIHQAGVVHRDFKPANVLVPPDGPRVIDFGIARALDATGTLSSTAVGTPAYMAPEQISGARVGPEADVFAWGTTMVFAATGRPAFGQDSIPAVMHRILNLPPDLGALADPLRDVVLQCLSKDPAVRPSSQQVLVQLLTLAGSLPQAGGSGPQDQPATMLTQGAAAAAAVDAGPLLPPPSGTPAGASGPSGASGPGVLAPPALPPGFERHESYQPPPPQQHQQQLPHQHQRFPHQQPPNGPYGAPGPYGTPPPGAPPPGNGGVAAPWQQAGTSPGVQITSPPGGPGAPGGPRRRPSLGVLAGAGSAALVALVVTGSVIAVNVLGDEEKDRPTTTRKGGTFSTVLNKFYTGEDLNPTQAGFGTGSRFVTKQLFTGLTEVTPAGAVTNRVATRVAPIDSACTSWQIDVRSGTRFSNGEAVTAESFVRGWIRAAQGKAGAAGTLMSNIKGYGEVSGGRSSVFTGARAAGQSRIDVTLDKPDCEFDRRLSDPAFFPVPSTAGKSDHSTYNGNPVGNGPFKIESYTRDQRLTLVRNESWGFGQTNLDRVDVRFTDDAQTVGRAGFGSGEYHWTEVSTQQLPAARASAGSQGTVLVRPSMSMNYLVPITTTGPMKSKEARLAVSYALDRKEITSTLFGGAYTPAAGLVSPAVPGFGHAGVCPSCAAPDATRAKQLAEDGGLKPGSKLTLYVRDLTTYRQWSEIVQRRLQQTLGVVVEIKTVPLDDAGMRKVILAKDAPGGLLTYGWAPDYPSAYSALHPILGGDQVATGDNGLVNFSGWRNEEFDQALGNAIKTPQGSSRLSGFQQAEKLALDDMALIPLWSYGRPVLASTKFAGLGPDHDGDPQLATASLK